MNKKNLIIFIIVIIVVLAAAAVVYIYHGEKLKEGLKDKFRKIGVGVDFNIGADLSNVGQGTESALKNMPPTNPLENLTNPFRDAYKNPFK